MSQIGNLLQIGVNNINLDFCCLISIDVHSLISQNTWIAISSPLVMNKSQIIVFFCTLANRSHWSDDRDSLSGHVWQRTAIQRSILYLLNKWLVITAMKAQFMKFLLIIVCDDLLRKLFNPFTKDKLPSRPGWTANRLKCKKPILSNVGKLKNPYAISLYWLILAFL